MTQRLYYTDAYLRSFEARVLEVSPDGTRVYLDRTAFYPSSGGQAFDTGSLAGVAVVDVVDEGERIAHLFAVPAPAPLAIGSAVEGRVDWGRRFDHMQQHTGQHLLSALLHERFGWKTVSVHFGAGSSSLDLDVGGVPPERIEEAEREANSLVFANLPVSVSFEEADVAEGLRKASGRAGTLRVVAIEGLDRAACGGTHVRATGEIGPILIRGVDRVRKSARLEFVCGMRAVARARADFLALSGIARSLSTSLDEAPAVVEGQVEQHRAALAELKGARQELAEVRAHALADAAEPNAAGVRWIVLREAAGGAEALRALALAVAALPGAVLLAAMKEPPSVLMAASPDSGVEAGRALKEALTAVGGRGGGSPRVAQGSVPDEEAAKAVLEALTRTG